MGAIIEEGKSDYQIVTPGRFSPPETEAARTLQKYLHRMTGVRLPLRWRKQRLPDRPAILVGIGREQETPALWEKDSYEILTEGRDLILRGSGRRGTHYAVSAYLESLGVRFFGPDHVHVPSRPSVPLPEHEVRSTAAFGYRHVFYPTAQEPEWALRWKLNVHAGRDARWGPNASAHSFGHSFNALVPVAEHFRAHPEYFSLVDGVRRDRSQQLCCTNPEVAEIAAASMARRIDENPDKRIFAVGMNDWRGWCECPECAAADEREGGHTGQLITLVNRVAERFPDRIIATLAYSWAIDPPRETHALENVLIVLCHNEGCYNHALDGCEHNARFLERLEGWKSKSGHILIWDYYVNYHSYLMPTPNLRRIERDIRTYRDYEIEGMFCQGSACRGGQFEGVRQYLQSKLLWDPDLEAWPIVEEWFRGVSGESAADILDYLKMLHDHVDDNDVHMLSFGAGQEIQPEMFPPEVLERGKELWDRAEEVAETPERRRTVFALRAPEMCARLFHAGFRYEVEGDELRPVPEPDLELRDRFVSAALEGGAAHLREDDGAPEAFGVNYGRTYRVHTLREGDLAAVVAPEMGGRIYSLKWKQVELMNVQDLLRYANYLGFATYFAYGGGYEFSLSPDWGGPGAKQEYRTEEYDGSSRVVMSVELEGDLKVTSAFALSGDALSVEHRVANHGRAPARVSPFTHPEWNLHAFGSEATVEFRSAEGTWRAMPLNPENRDSRDMSFQGDLRPVGGWRLRSAAHELLLEETFEADAVESSRILFSQRGGNLNLELYFRQTEIAPGAEATFRTKWKIGAP